MERNEIKNILEALLFITDQPLTVSKLKNIFDKQAVDDFKECIDELRRDYDARAGALRIDEIAGGYQIATKPEYGEWVKKLYKDRITYRLTKSSLETLSIIAYKQPVTRAEIEQIRGVDVSAVLERLLERRLIRICGRKEVIGRPILYGTTTEFLKFFGLKDLSEIPDIDELASRTEVIDEHEEEAVETAEDAENNLSADITETG